MLVNLLLLLFAIPTIIIRGTHAGLQELSISDRSSVSERTMKSILESCYDDDSLSDAFVVVGDFNEFTDKLPMIRINLKNPPNYSFPYFKLRRAIIVFDSLKELEMNIKFLERMRWWNHMASFFIITENLQLCENRSDILLGTWIKGMINSIYICPDSMNTSVLYTINANANYAPHPWEFKARHFAMNYFSQRFDKNMSCQNLNYDKTIKLNAVLMTVVAQEAPTAYSNLIRNNNLPWGMVIAAVNALKIGNTIYTLKQRNSAFESLYEGSMDLVLFLRSIEKDPGTKFLFPYSQDRIIAVIKSSPEKSMHYQVFHLWNFSVIFLAFIALAILFVILLRKNNEFSSALLSIIQMIIHSSTPINIRNNPFRIFLTTILIMMIISHRVFQGRMITFRITREKNEPIERIEILIQLGYKLYSTPGLEELIEKHCPECHAMTVEHDECFNYVLKDELTACLTEESMYQHAASLPFELVREPLVQTLLVTKCRDNWPLYDRMNDMWMRMFESGLRKFWETKKNYRIVKGEHQVEDKERSSTQYRPIKLNELWFAFAFLLVGLSLSTIVFIAELLVKKYGDLWWFNGRATDS